MTPVHQTTNFRKSASKCLFAAVLLPVTLALPAFADVSREKPLTMDQVVVKETKTHTLFMGADISINLDRDLYPVRDVTGSSWVIDINHQERVVSAREAPLNLKITPTLKLTEGSATIAGFKREAAYSYANDPSVRLTQGLSRASALNTDLVDVARNAQARVDTMQNKAFGPMAGLAASDNQFGDAALLAQAGSSKGAPYVIPKGGYTQANVGAFIAQYAAAVASSQAKTLADAQQVAASASSQTANGNEPVGTIATQGFDAMDIEFSISSPKPLYHPYVVTMTRFHAKNSKPGLVQNLVFAKSLDPIHSQISHVHFSEEGFPFNYELIDFQIHIYDGGKEVATNLAQDRVELTRDEAFEYVKSEYVGAHPHATLPPVAVMGSLPSDLPAKLNSGKYDATFYVKVNKQGLAAQAFGDEACTKPIDDPYLDTVVNRVRFKPALVDGRPVDGISALNLNKLTI
jgi:hypothetical protein